MSVLMEAAKGRACLILVSAPRSFDAATIFIALVILAVEVTAFNRMESAWRDGCEREGRAGRGENGGEVARGAAAAAGGRQEGARAPCAQGRGERMQRGPRRLPCC